MYQTNLVDEFRTSKLYHKDHSLLNLVSKRSSLDINEAKSQSLRGLLWYCSTNKSSNFVNRDLNAAINILNL
jgi:transposase